MTDEWINSENWEPEQVAELLRRYHGYDEAIRQRDEAIRDWRETAIERNEAQMQCDDAVRLLRDVDEVWEPLTGKCDVDCICLIHPVRAFLTNFKEDSTND